MLILCKIRGIERGHFGHRQNMTKSICVWYWFISYFMSVHFGNFVSGRHIVASVNNISCDNGGACANKLTPGNI